MANFIRKLFIFTIICKMVLSAPTQTSERGGKSLGYFDYVQPVMDYTYDEGSDYDDLEDNEISRTVPKRKRIKARPAYDSPIYYIRLPPQPYMFVPGLGYVSQPASSPVTQLVNLPVSFVSNGKPNGIYQWSGAMGQFPSVSHPAPQPIIPPVHQVARPVEVARPIINTPIEAPQTTEAPKPVKPTDSTIHRLPGQYIFNGKPNDIFVLRDSYNSFYSDALQNFYP